MPDDPSAMSHRREPMALLRFAVREGDVRLAELVMRALWREGPVPVGAAAAPRTSMFPPSAEQLTSMPSQRRSTAPPSPLARRTLDALLILLAVDEPSRGRGRERDA